MAFSALRFSCCRELYQEDEMKWAMACVPGMEHQLRQEFHGVLAFSGFCWCLLEHHRSFVTKDTHWPALAVDMFLLLGACMVLCSCGGFKNYQAIRTP